MKTTNTKYTPWFTLVELIVTATILVIITAVGFYSYSQSLLDARDLVRKSDVADIESRLKLYKQQRWAYPIPGDAFTITNSWVTVAQQWKLNENVSLTTADEIPKDPYVDTYYTYSVTNNKQEFEISLTLENADNPVAVLEWSYKSVSRNVLPTISLALDTSGTIEIHDGIWTGSTNRMMFIFNNWSYNLPYTFESPYAPQTDGTTSFTGILNDPNILYWQNSDYRNCTEIYDAGKSVSSGSISEEYQILNTTGALIDTTCDFS